MNITRKQHFLNAALFWTITGGVMGFFGFKWVWHGFAPQTAGLLVFICATVGLLKGHFVIGKSAKRSIERVRTLPERSPFYQVFSKGTWGLVLGMMSLGMIIRHLGFEKPYRGLVLSAIGMALLWASRLFWSAAIGHGGITAPFAKGE